MPEGGRRSPLGTNLPRLDAQDGQRRSSSIPTHCHPATTSSLALPNSSCAPLLTWFTAVRTAVSAARRLMASTPSAKPSGRVPAMRRTIASTAPGSGRRAGCAVEPLLVGLRQPAEPLPEGRCRVVPAGERLAGDHLAQRGCPDRVEREGERDRRLDDARQRGHLDPAELDQVVAEHAVRGPPAREPHLLAVARMARTRAPAMSPGRMCGRRARSTAMNRASCFSMRRRTNAASRRVYRSRSSGAG
jgi:hypothetical protein